MRYVLEGSVRKAGNRVRITGQLIDTTTGAHIWADRFDRAPVRAQAIDLREEPPSCRGKTKSCETRTLRWRRLDSKFQFRDALAPPTA